jgi:hypothetical protein
MTTFNRTSPAARALANGCVAQCECGCFHTSSLKAIACEQCRRELTADEYGIRRVTDIATNKVIWETPLAHSLQAEDDARIEREHEQDLLNAARAVTPTPLTFNPFANLLS